MGRAGYTGAAQLRPPGGLEDMMADLDRAALIELLGRLGADSDETALQAARELSQTVSESGLTWDELLRTSFGAGGAEAAPTDVPVAAESNAPRGGKAEVAQLIDRLLARKSLSDTLRDDLTELKGAIADGTFEDMDADYIRALAKRMGV
jgi:hypothetical protein